MQSLENEENNEAVVYSLSEYMEGVVPFSWKRSPEEAKEILVVKSQEFVVEVLGQQTDLETTKECNNHKTSNKLFSDWLFFCSAACFQELKNKIKNLEENKQLEESILLDYNNKIAELDAWRYISEEHLFKEAIIMISPMENKELRDFWEKYWKLFKKPQCQNDSFSEKQKETRGLWRKYDREILKEIEIRYWKDKQENKKLAKDFWSEEEGPLLKKAKLFLDYWIRTKAKEEQKEVEIIQCFRSIYKIDESLFENEEGNNKKMNFLSGFNLIKNTRDKMIIKTENKIKLATMTIFLTLIAMLMINLWLKEDKEKANQLVLVRSLSS